ncbi:MAG: catalase-related domain-containing protein [Ilumatobacteraceae bacterium]
MTNPVGRINYEPNSASGDERGPREDPAGGFTTFPAREAGAAERVRSETFADHYSQARQFLISQTENEQAHIVGGFVFELSKVENLDIRVRMVANLRNVDEAFATRIAEGLGLDDVPLPHRRRARRSLTSPHPARSASSRTGRARSPVARSAPW